MKRKKNKILIIIFGIILILASYLIFSQLTKINNEENKIYCKQEQRETDICSVDYNPVCGWFNESINCFRYPCAVVFSNSCSACANPTVEFYTKGKCPK